MSTFERQQRLSLLMERVGFAVWQLQELEAAMATYVVVRLRDARGVGMEKGTELQGKEDKRTMGSLFKELARQGVVDPRLSAQLQAVIQERNWLVHRARRETRGVLSDERIFFDTVSRIDAVAENGLSLLKELGQQIEAFVVASGVDPQWIEREAERIAATWRM